MFAVYGEPPRELAEAPKGAIQTSDLIPGSRSLSELVEGSVGAAVVYAPPGAIERRYVLAQALRALATGGGLTALAPKDRGGGRLGRELAAFGCQVFESAKRHHRICRVEKPAAPTGLEGAIAEGAPRHVDGLGWTQPGIFSWDRLDPGTALLMECLPALAGQGADFGCGVGLLSQLVLRSPGVITLSLIDIDRRAVDCARRNVDDPRARFEWADVRTTDHSGLDFVVMNPPFHDGGREDRALGQAFVAQASRSLKPGGCCWLVANRHLPYEAPLAEHFSSVRLVRETGAFKVYEARR
ncbi:MAG TPA: class I SAM-dependent methyltransferase [Caulobacteraceae bacterium]|nr:class I SAM-dependent methyltransferase [Caulobacteraceae bacterium]